MSARIAHHPVALVGAGPGDPELLTLRARRLIDEADVVVHDRLVSGEIMETISADILRIDAGKARGAARDSQDEIHRRLVDLARSGLRVVRLKGGDPFVFGRGSEEQDALAAEGIDSEVVAGLSSALAGPAAAGVPMTERGRAKSFAVVTAETCEQGSLEHLGKVAGADTLVLMMGASRLGDVARELIRLGRPADQPAAAIERATRPDQRVVVSTLGDLGMEVARRGLAAPMVVVLGDVAERARLRLRAGAPRPDKTPLAGKRLLVTRPEGSALSLARRLRELGAEPVIAPLIEIRLLDPETFGPALDLDVDWLVFTSRHGVEGFRRLIEHRGLDARALGGKRLAAVGPITAASLEAWGLRADLIPPSYRAESLVESLRETRAGSQSLRPRVLFPCGTRARRETSDGLRAEGFDVEELVVYETRPRKMEAGVREQLSCGVDAILFHSPSAVESFAASGLRMGGVLAACIGPTTAEAARRSGFSRVLVSDEHSDEGLLKGLGLALSGRSSLSETEESHGLAV